MQARSSPAAFVALLLLARPAASQTKLEAIPDPIKLPAAEVPYVHPLWRAVDTPPKLLEVPKATDLETTVSLFLTVKVDTKGNVLDAVGVEPPLKGLTAPLQFLIPKWRFTPAKKEGRPVVTWASMSFDLLISMEKGVFPVLKFLPVEKEEPLQAPIREFSGEAWLKRFPKAISPPDAGALSVEEVDFLPNPEKTKWSWDATRLRSRVSALVLVPSSGAVSRIVPTGPGYEPFITTWLRSMVAKWKIAPAVAKGKPVDCWMTLEGSVEYTVDTAKDKGRRTLQKNLRATPVD